MRVTAVEESVIRDIGHAFGYYDYGAEHGLIDAFPSREAAAAPILARAAHVPVVLVTHVAAEAERLSAALVRMDKADGAPVSGVLRKG